jgi:hypothetical protein
MTNIIRLPMEQGFNDKSCRRMAEKLLGNQNDLIRNVIGPLFTARVLLFDFDKEGQ